MFSRLITLTITGAVGWTLLYGCPIIGHKYQHASKGVLILVLVGMVGGITHIIGYSPRNIALKIILNRWVARILMLSPLYLHKL